MTGVTLITCCYCGARDVMRMGKGERRVLGCLSCGAPIRKIEPMKQGSAPAPAEPPKRLNKHRKKDRHHAWKKRKKKKSFLHKLTDAFDLDDIFDFD
ncbi:MAG: hypothetical protein ACK5MQ_07125 [Pikeienuella sp.]